MEEKSINYKNNNNVKDINQSQDIALTWILMETNVNK